MERFLKVGKPKEKKRHTEIIGKPWKTQRKIRKPKENIKNIRTSTEIHPKTANSIGNMYNLEKSLGKINNYLKQTLGNAINNCNTYKTCSKTKRYFGKHTGNKKKHGKPLKQVGNRIEKLWKHRIAQGKIGKTDKTHKH